MKRHAVLFGALAATLVTGCASLDNQKTPELYDTATSTGTNIDRPGLPPKVMDQMQIERTFRNPAAAMPGPAPGGN